MYEMCGTVKIVNRISGSPDDKEHAVDADWLPSSAVDDESSSSLEPDALTVGIEEPVVATEGLTFLKHCRGEGGGERERGRERERERERERGREREREREKERDRKLTNISL